MSPKGPLWSFISRSSLRWCSLDSLLGSPADSKEAWVGGLLAS